MKLLQPIRIGDLNLKNRIFIAPLTRCRASEGNIPNELNAEYYTQRATAGLIISEATTISIQGFGYTDVPGIFTNQQIEGWKIVTNAVHKSDGKIFCQLWHVGRVSHPSINGLDPVSASAINSGGKIRTPLGLIDRVTPRELKIEEIYSTIEDYKQAAINAIDAGFDGVEIHGANGYLIDQFLCDGSNKRNDDFGGSLENRFRFLHLIISEIVNAIGNHKTGLRISPSGIANGIFDSNPVIAFEYYISQLNKFNLAYLHIMEPYPMLQEGDYLNYLRQPTKHFRNFYNGTIVTNSNFTKETAESALNEGWADAVAFGKLFISNPDLVKRFELDLELNPWDTSTYYSKGAIGYTDYPFITK
ncbi:MAG: alkene reductase [Candidatus Kapabacteria bacterium]|nr:alkene reductase [Candidatus Kapabacteria bacterium]